MKKMKGTIVEAGMWSIIGTLLVKGTYFLTIPLYSRLLTTADYIASVLALSIMIFIVFIGIFQHLY